MNKSIKQCTEKELEDLYNLKLWSFEQIGKYLGVSKQAVSKKFGTKSLNKARDILTVKCSICDKVIRITRSAYNRSRTGKFYCSRKCWIKYLKND